MTPEQIAEAGQRLARLEQVMSEDHRRHVRRSKTTTDPHEPESYWLYHAECAEKNRAALALAQQALREWVPREDRERVAGPLAQQTGWRHREILRLLKLEDTP